MTTLQRVDGEWTAKADHFVELAGTGPDPASALDDLVSKMCAELEKHGIVDTTKNKKGRLPVAMRHSPADNQYWKRTRGHMQTLGSESMSVPVVQLKALVEHIDALRSLFKEEA